MLSIWICPETPTELQAVLRLLHELAIVEPGPGLADTRTKTSSAPVREQPASTAEDAADAADVVSIDPPPSSGEPGPAYSAQQVLEALQDYARVNGAVGLKNVLERFGARRVSDIKPEHYPEMMTIARGEPA